MLSAPSTFVTTEGAPCQTLCTEEDRRLLPRDHAGLSTGTGAPAHPVSLTPGSDALGRLALVAEGQGCCSGLSTQGWERRTFLLGCVAGFTVSRGAH